MTVRTLRLLNALAIGILLGWLCVVIVRAEDDSCDGPNPDESCVIVYHPGMCSYLEPYGYWWYFWNCGATNDATAETVTITEEPDGAHTTRIERTHPDGSVSQLVRVQRPSFVPRSRRLQ